MIDTQFGERLEKEMKEKGISNQMLTKMADISKNNIGNYKNGQIPNATILYKLSQILGITMEYLLTGKESEALDPDEQRLVDLYRKADDRGKRRIQQTAELEVEEPKSSTSKIG